MAFPDENKAPTPSAPIPIPIIPLPNNISIRAYHPSDAPSISLSANNPAIKNNLRNRFPHPYLESDALTWISLANDPTNAIATGPLDTSSTSTTTTGTGPKIPTHCTITVNSIAVGSIGLDFASPAEIYARSAELGYWLDETYWGKGIMGVVVPAFVEWAWRTFGVLERLNAEVESGNVRSRRILERAGFAVEGRRERAIWRGGEFRSVLLLGMLRPEALR